MNVKRVLTGGLVLILMIMVILSGCKKENASAYKVIDSGIWTYREPIEKTFWLDNERVLVVSNKTLAPGGPESKIMTIWNTKTNKIDFSHKVRSLICVENEQVFFYVKDETTGKYKNYRGTLDNPKEHPAPGPNMRIDYFDCGWRPKSDDSKVPYIIELKDNNYLEIIETRGGYSNSEYGKARYYESLDKPPIPLPVYVHMGDYDISFNQIRNAYFISPTQYFPNDPYYQSLWWLQRDGTITEEPLPIPLPFVKPLSKSLSKGYIRGGVRFYPLYNGYLIHSNTGEINSRGLYFMKGQNIEKILLGSIHGVSISPEGCRVAFIHAKNTKEYFSQKKPYRTVKTINFCEGRK